MSKKTKIKIYITLLAIVIGIIGYSYAYFVLNKAQTNSNSVSVMDCFAFDYSEETGTEISLENAISKTNADGMKTSPYQFSVSNTCDDTILKVNIYIEDNDSTIGLRYVRASLNPRDDRTDKSIIVNDTERIRTSNSQNGYKLSDVVLEGKQTINYDLRIWIDEKAEFDDVSGDSFYGKIHTIVEPLEQLPPDKGALITMNVGDGLPTSYRVMKINGTIAEVLAMTDYNVGTGYAFDTDVTTTTFSNAITGIKYAGSDMDILLNNTIYNEMNNAAKSAILARNINQYMYGWADSTWAIGSRSQGIDYWQSLYNFESPITYYIVKLGSDSPTGYVNIGNRYVYLLDVTDILEYFNNEIITSEETNTLFFNQSSKYNTGNASIGYYHLRLRSANNYYSNYSWSYNAVYGSIGVNSYEHNLGVRPAFTIDLSKIEWSLAS